MNNPLSFASYKIDVLSFIENYNFENPKNIIGSATGFLYKRNNLIYLITNWHVVNERDFWEKGRKRSQRHPTHLIFTPSFSINEKECVKDTRSIIIPLYDDLGNPNWLVHPKWKNNVDVIAILIPYTINCETNTYDDLLAINELEKTLHMDLSVTDELFVVGYPYGLGSNQKGTLPIWKKCIVASEPELEYLSDKRPTFLIDGITNPSMSGSPVIRFVKSAINTTTGLVITNPRIELYGIYSGRISVNIEANKRYGTLNLCDKMKNEIDNSNNSKSSFNCILSGIQNLIEEYVRKVVRREIENDTKIGLVWKANLIDEIIDGNQRDEIIYDDQL